MKLVLAFLIPACASAATYHVTPTGADSNSGASPGTALRTIQKAADRAQPGDLILIHAGTYAETVTIRNSGAPDRPITFRGQRGPNGEWLARIDPSVPLAAEWSPAPEAGEGVFKTAFPGFEPFLMLVDGRFIPRIWPTHMQNGLGFQKLAYPPDQRVAVGRLDLPKAGGTGVFFAGTGEEIDPAGVKTIPYWDTVGAMYGCRDSMIYLRFRDREHPSLKSIRAAPQGGGIEIAGASWIVLRDLLVQGSQQGIAIKGPHAEHNVIETCRLVNAAQRINLEDASHCIVRDNEITAEFYADLCQTGAWGDGAAGANISDELGRKFHFYREYKHFFGPNSTSDHGIKISGGEGNTIQGNRVNNGGQGIHLSRTTGARIHGNTVEGMSSTGITPTMDHIADVHIHDNRIIDCNIAIRVHHVNEHRQTGPRSLYIYRNLVWQKPGVGTAIFFHFHDKNDTDPYPHPFIAIYHNTFAGGSVALYPNANADRVGGLPGTLIVNNQLACPQHLATNSRFRALKNAWTFDHNWLGGSGPIDAVWFGRGNVDAAGQKLPDTSSGPPPVLPSPPSARNAGMDISKPFTLSGKNFDPLPGFAPGYFTGKAPDCGVPST